MDRVARGGISEEVICEQQPEGNGRRYVSHSALGRGFSNAKVLRRVFAQGLTLAMDRLTTSCDAGIWVKIPSSSGVLFCLFLHRNVQNTHCPIVQWEKLGCGSR